MSEAIELFKADGSVAGIFYCSECRTVFKTKSEANDCHGKRLCSCGKARPRYYGICDDCRRTKEDAQETAKELARFDKATKIPEAEYGGGMVYDGDKYYTEIEDALDNYLDGHQPEYVWACKDVGIPKADSESIVEHLLDNMWEDADSSDLNGLDDLDAAIAKFNDENRSIAVWQPDYTTAILIEHQGSKTA